MYNTIPEQLRKLAIENVFSTNTYKNCWETWQPEILRLLGSNYTENEILNIGDHLSDIFRSTGGGGRGQGELSASGTAWESLVCWYINLISVGSRVVAIKKMSLVPKAIQDAITVNYGNFACNTESDITIIVFPNLPEYKTDINQLNVLTQLGNQIQPFIRNKCFSYSFVTVPSNQNTVYNPQGVAVKRVTNLSGGNYWGSSSVQNVAKSLKEIFTNNFQTGSTTGLRTDIRTAIPELRANNSLSYFGLY
ncbi:MAG: hypothetical protein IPJ22_08130 [Bacteroidetes bacterium]|nr:hypothetical protein [Bacteroidota bacterium]